MDFSPQLHFGRRKNHYLYGLKGKRLEPLTTHSHTNKTADAAWCYRQILVVNGSRQASITAVVSHL